MKRPALSAVVQESRNQVKPISVTNRVALSTLFAAAMAYVVGATAIYLRLLVNGRISFFPLDPIPPFLYHMEIVRELAAIVMLAVVARLQSRRFTVNVAFFFYCFGVWDILYYVWLKILVGWPASLLSWDVLFLVPCRWIAPVLAPSIVSLLFITGSLVILRFETIGKPIRFTLLDWVSDFIGAVLILASFFWELPRIAKTGHPGTYPWWLFGVGAAVWVVMFIRRALLTWSGRSSGDERRSVETESSAPRTGGS